MDKARKPSNSDIIIGLSHDPVESIPYPQTLFLNSIISFPLKFSGVISSIYIFVLKYCTHCPDLIMVIIIIILNKEHGQKDWRKREMMKEKRDWEVLEAERET
jgi:hypothetical protein